MFQFTERETESLRKRAAQVPDILKELTRLTKEILQEPVLVPHTGIANWYMYYFCPDCSVPLTFNRHDRHHHSCPQCKKVFTGDPYDSAWWRIINGNNYTGAYHLGLLFLLTQDMRYARKGIEILSAYADYYRGYEVHGSIPYNGPGKVGAQTLDDANFTRNTAMAYDLLEPAMDEMQKKNIKEDLLQPAAEFLMPRRHRQRHNHELIISAAVGMAALILNREDWIQYAIYEDYGLLYQLEHGVRDSGMWFEGTFGYHFYALEGFFQYERFAVHTKHSHIHHPLYRRMLKAAAVCAQPDFNFPMINDTYSGHGSLKGKAGLYEFAYRETKDEELLEILRRMYQDKARGSLESFFWGAERLPEKKDTGKGAGWNEANSHPPIGQAGITSLRGRDDRYLLFKHDEFGGEHDHYDRLGLSFLAYGRRIAADLGTTGYGAVLHFDYYKNSGAHNTVTIGERNHPPGKACLTRFEEIDGVIYAEAVMDWKQEYEMPPIFTIPDWDESLYQGITMTRKLAWTEHYFAECFIVEGAEDQTIDWGMHIGGEFAGCSDSSGKRMMKPLGQRLSQKKPLRHMKDIYYIEETGEKAAAKLEEDAAFRQSECTVCSCFQVEEVGVKLYSYLPEGSLYVGKVPNNPSAEEISQVIERRNGRGQGEAETSEGRAKERQDQVVFLHVMEAYDKESVISWVQMDVGKEEAVISIEEMGIRKEIRFALSKTER
ncbi:MAG: heparinase II/III family protein [Lachnospiraceae bacterium]|nr:heparinase II/III family protein [Lachnospiraceae bacterium]